MKTGWKGYAIGLSNIFGTASVVYYATVEQSEFASNLLYFLVSMAWIRVALYLICGDGQAQEVKRKLSRIRNGTLPPTWMMYADLAISMMMLIGFGWFWCGVGLMLNDSIDLVCREKAIEKAA